MHESEFNEVFDQTVQAVVLTKRDKQLEAYLIASGYRPTIVVRYKPLQAAEEDRCFRNVEAQVGRSGGRLVTGWKFVEEVGLMIVGEAHGIWEDRFGKKFDITPQPTDGKGILFCPDDRVAEKRSYTFPRPKLLITEDPRFRALDAFRDRLRQAESEKFKGFGSAFDISAEEVALMAASTGVPLSIAQKIVSRGAESSRALFQMYAEKDGLRPVST